MENSEEETWGGAIVACDVMSLLGKTIEFLVILIVEWHDVWVSPGRDIMSHMMTILIIFSHRTKEQQQNCSQDQAIRCAAFSGDPI